MTVNLDNERAFQDTVETHLKILGYNTGSHTTLHTRPTHLLAEMHQHPKGPFRLLITCIHNKTTELQEVQKFCSKVAFARENLEANSGILISNKEFSPETIAWCEEHCSFVRLRAFRHLI
jgi:hypothetical protein